MLVRMFKCVFGQAGNIISCQRHQTRAAVRQACAVRALNFTWGTATCRHAGYSSLGRQPPQIIRRASDLPAGNSAAADDEHEDDITNHPAYSKAMARAMRLINFRERSSHELCKRLQEDEYPAELVEAVLGRVQQMGLQDDARFAEMFAWGRWRTKSLSPSRIRHELQSQHHVGSDAIDSALVAVFGNEGRLAPMEEHLEEEDEHHALLTSSPPDAWALLMAKAQRHAESSYGQPSEKRKAKMVRWLQYRGHNWDTVKRVLKELDL